jgi:hypothetical protein
MIGETEDLAALKLALDLLLADPDEDGRPEQLQMMLRGFGNEPPRPWRAVAEFAAYVCQTHRLKLHPAQSPPCQLSELEADEILTAGPILAFDGSGADISDCRGARLLKAMLGLGISRYHPDPLRAIAEARGRTLT